MQACGWESVQCCWVQMVLSRAKRLRPGQDAMLQR